MQTERFKLKLTRDFRFVCVFRLLCGFRFFRQYRSVRHLGFLREFRFDRVLRFDCHLGFSCEYPGFGQGKLSNLGLRTANYLAQKPDEQFFIRNLREIVPGYSSLSRIEGFRDNIKGFWNLAAVSQYS